jgi:hypothetical protein
MQKEIPTSCGKDGERPVKRTMTYTG